MQPEHFFQRLCSDAAVRSVTDRFAADKADYLRRLVHHPGAIGDGERERAVLPDEHLETACAAVLFRKTLELGPSSG